MSAKGGSKEKVMMLTCPKHPHAQILHSWDETTYILNGYPAGKGIQSNHRYHCAECMIEMAAPNGESSDSRE